MDADNGRSCGFRPERLLFRQRGVPVFERVAHDVFHLRGGQAARQADFVEHDADILLDVPDAFGVVALVALTPLIAVQLMGLHFNVKDRGRAAVESAAEDEIIEFVEDWYA